jgi:two-component system, sensor histidine kinase LadS
MLMVVNLRDFLASRPVWRRTAWVLVALNALPVPMSLAGQYAAPLKVINPATFVSILFALAISMAAWRQGYRHTRWFLLGAGFVLLGLLAERLRLASVLPDTPLFAYSMAIGSVLEALFIAVALADGVNRLKADKLAAERLAREAEARLNEQLGELVHERTLALESANERLARLAITDELTGAYNRRHFEHELAQALARAHRGGGAVGLCLFDLDHFKGYNDRYGHPAGDEV